MAVPGQEDLPGMPPSTPLLRSKDVTHLPTEFRYEGWKVWIARGMNDDALHMEQCKVDAFSFDFYEGGKMDYEFRISTADLDEEGAGMLWGRQKRKVFVRIEAPELPAAGERTEATGDLAQAARDKGIYVRGAISTAVGCPYEGDVAPERVELVARLMKEIGVQHVGVADTIGVGTPRKVQAVMERALKHYPMHEVSGHFHDTYGQALANTLASVELGVRVVDASVAGLGGCPYAAGASGNVASEDVVYMLHGLGLRTGIDLVALVNTGRWISSVLERDNGSKVGRALKTGV